jgi:UDP-N-acetylmuramyl pentapeptide phosphotransferase/UDP-N-acetylglucosamine-1-phosphate transferase
MPGTVAGAIGVAFLVALVLVPLLVRFAIGRNLLDVPNARSSHEIPTPRLGGLAVVAGVWAASPLMKETLIILVAATLAGLVGLLDDLLNLRFWLKAAGQAVVALILLFVLPPSIFEAAGPLWPAALCFSVLWVVAVVNAYNFMDGIDGIVSGTVILNALFLMALAGATPVSGSITGLAALGAAVAGFLMWNISPARIFLGDSGSHFVGFFLGTVALYAEPVNGNPYLSFVVVAAVFTPFLFDTAFTLIKRAGTGKNIFDAHREHIYQRITPDPSKHRQVSNVYYALAALAGLAALLAAEGTPLRLFMGGAIVAGCCLLMALLPNLATKRG